MRIRPAQVDDTQAIERIVERAYGVYIERIGTRPGPMDDDFFDDEGSARLIEQHDDELDDIGAYARLVTPPIRPEESSDQAT